MVATGHGVQLVAADVVLDNIPRGSLLDVNALVAVRGYAVSFNKVVVAIVEVVALVRGFGRRQRRRRDERCVLVCAVVVVVMVVTGGALYAYVWV